MSVCRFYPSAREWQIGEGREEEELPGREKGAKGGERGRGKVVKELGYREGE